MNLNISELLAILDMCESCINEGNATDDIKNLVSKITLHLSNNGFPVCGKCSDLIKESSFDNVHIESDGTVYELCDSCINVFVEL